MRPDGEVTIQLPQCGSSSGIALMPSPPAPARQTPQGQEQGPAQQATVNGECCGLSDTCLSPLVSDSSQTHAVTWAWLVSLLRSANGGQKAHAVEAWIVSCKRPSDRIGRVFCADQLTGCRMTFRKLVEILPCFDDLIRQAC